MLRAKCMLWKDLKKALSKLLPPADIETLWKQKVNAMVELKPAWLSVEGLSK